MPTLFIRLRNPLKGEISLGIYTRDGHLDGNFKDERFTELCFGLLFIEFEINFWGE